MNEVATVLVDSTATLGLIPCGSGDGLGRHLGIHGAIPRALEILRTGRARMIDTGFADGHAFFTAAGLGFEADIAQRFNGLRRRGFVRYLTTSARGFFSARPQNYLIEHDGRRETLTAFTLAVTNSNQYGNNARIAPDALVDDGLLDLCAVPPISFWNALPLAAHLFHGTIGRVRGVQLRRSARFVVERAGEGLLHTDGELHAAGRRIEFTVRPLSLRVMCAADPKP
jgi:diacylglycerol kinase (ATP)